MSPFYAVAQPLGLCKAHKSPGQRKETQKKLTVIRSDTNLGLKRDLANKTNALIKGGAVGGWLQTMRNCFATLLRSHVFRHASKVAHLAVEHKSGTLVFLCGFGMDRKKKRKKAGTAAVVGGLDRAAPAPHRQITLERTHHLCSFVELSHFNPPAGPIWELT